MKVFHVRETLLVEIYFLKIGAEHCTCVRISVRAETSKQHSFAEHPCRGIPLINVGNGSDLFSRDVALFRVISGVIDLIIPEEVRLIKPCCEKIYHLHINGTKVQNNYYKSIRAVLSAIHMIAMARSFYP